MDREYCGVPVGEKKAQRTYMGGERDCREAARGRLTAPTNAQLYNQSKSYGATKAEGAIGAAAAADEHDERTSRRRGQQQHAEESSLLRRSLAGVGVLALFAFAVTTANYGRLEKGQLGAANTGTSFDRASYNLVRVLPFSGFTCIARSHSLLPDVRFLERRTQNKGARGADQQTVSWVAV